MKIAASILSSDPGAYRDVVRSMEAGGADWIHFDVMDGQFVPPITFGADLVSCLRGEVRTPFEAHLMTLTPERHFEAFLRAGCQRVVFHAEATPHAHRLCAQLRDGGVRVGLAINPGTPVTVLEALADSIDLGLVMTVDPGWGGQSLIEGCVGKVKRLRALAPDLEIEVDGGVTPHTIGRLLEAGANTFVAGSYLAEAAGPAVQIARLREACASRF